jgi:thiol:disulfide interchange protein DsbD
MELLSARADLRPRESVWVAVRITPRKGWHTYWKNPGDAGLPTSLSWTLPKGWKTGELQWPAPTRFQVKSLASYGYEGAVTLPLQLFAPANAELGTIDIPVRADWLVCEESCIPQDAQLSLRVTVAPGTPRMDSAGLATGNATAQAIAAALALVPSQDDKVLATARREGSHLVITARRLVGPAGELFIEQEEVVEPGPRPVTTWQGGVLTWRAQLGAKGKATAMITTPTRLDMVWVPANTNTTSAPAQRIRAQRFGVELK